MKKKITILGQEYFYIQCCDVNDYGEVCYWTIFYTDTEFHYRKKYFIFGPIIEWEEPIVLFRVEFDIEDLSYNKEELLLIIEKKVNRFLGLKNSEEVKKEDLI